MTRFLLLALCLSLAACASHTRSDCTFDVHLEDPLREVLSLLVVIDPHIPEERRARLADSISSGVQVLLSGDRDEDGTQDFQPPNALRLAVITTSGSLVSSLPTLPPPTPRSFVPDADGVLTVWPRTSAAWDAWFVSTVSQRLSDAFARPVAANMPSSATLAFLEAHPAFVPGSHMLLLVVTDRDEEGDADLVESFQAIRARDPSRVGVALIGAVPDGTNVRLGDFRGVLGPQTFDEANVACGDGTAAGRYPRRLMEMLERLNTTGSAVSLESHCDGRPGLLLTASGVGWRYPGRACLPVELPTEEGFVDCTATVLMPELAGQRCADFGLTLAATEGMRERCVLPQVLRSPDLFSEEQQGFFYVDLRGLYVCQRTPQQLELTTRIALTGATLDAQCRWPTPQCLATSDAGSLDAR